MSTRESKTAEWVYLKSEPQLYTVGFYSPDGKWHSESDHDNSEDAAQRVHYLNGGASGERPIPDEDGAL